MIAVYAAGRFYKITSQYLTLAAQAVGSGNEDIRGAILRHLRGFQFESVLAVINFEFRVEKCRSNQEWWMR